jgi:hypothetical protein
MEGVSGTKKQGTSSMHRRGLDLSPELQADVPANRLSFINNIKCTEKLLIHYRPLEHKGLEFYFH